VLLTSRPTARYTLCPESGEIGNKDEGEKERKIDRGIESGGRKGRAGRAGDDSNLRELHEGGDLARLQPPPFLSYLVPESRHRHHETSVAAASRSTKADRSRLPLANLDL
jgi:hypothetical protein